MKNLTVVSLDEDTNIYLETVNAEVQSGDDSLFQLASCGEKIIKKSKEYLEDAFNQIKVFSNGIVDSIKSMDARPDEFEIEFSVKFAAEGGIVISSVSSEASISVKLKWKKT